LTPKAPNRKFGTQNPRQENPEERGRVEERCLRNSRLARSGKGLQKKSRAQKKSHSSEKVLRKILRISEKSPEISEEIPNPGQKWSTYSRPENRNPRKTA
jgi:hypothetical protein